MNLIYNQTRIPKGKWRYGLRASAAVGCGWVAVYNALCLLDRPVKPEKLIGLLQWQEPVLNGPAGTVFWGPARLLRRMGFQVSMTADPEQFDEVAKNARVCILFYYWRRKWKLGSHFIALRYEQGRFQGFNTFLDSDGPDEYGPSLEAYIKAQGWFACVLTGIKEDA